MSNRKKILINAAVSGILSVGIVSGAYAKATATNAADDAAMGKCYGPNACAKNKCAKDKCAPNKCKSNYQEMTKKDCDELAKKEKKKYRFEKNTTAPTKQNKAEDNTNENEQTADADASDAPMRDPHE